MVTRSAVKLPLVSVVMPSFNQAPFLEEALESVLSQDYPHVELIVRDGGSTDGSVDIIEKYSPRLAFWASQRDRGQCDAINQGFEQSTGEIMCWLNSDDLLEPGAISAVVEHFRMQPDSMVVTGSCLCVDEAGTLIHRDTKKPLDGGDSRDALRAAGSSEGAQNLVVWFRDWFPQSSTFWRRAIWERVGPLDEAWNYSMDYELWRRMSRHSRIDVIDRVLSRYRYHSDAKCIVSTWGPMREVLEINRRDMPALEFSEFAESAIRFLIDRIEDRERRVGQLDAELDAVRESKRYRLGSALLGPIAFLRRGLRR